MNLYPKILGTKSGGVSPRYTPAGMGRGEGVGAAVGVAGVQELRRRTTMITAMNKARFKITSGSGEW